MAHPTVRLLTMLEILQAHPRITGAQLAERLEIDARTVRRYIALLQEWGIPIMATRGRYGAYRLMPGFKLPPLMLNEEEAIALTLGLLAVRRTDLALLCACCRGGVGKGRAGAAGHGAQAGSGGAGGRTPPSAPTPRGAGARGGCGTQQRRSGAAASRVASPLRTGRGDRVTIRSVWTGLSGGALVRRRALPSPRGATSLPARSCPAGDVARRVIYPTA